MLPDLTDVLASLHVVELPLVRRFRGVTSRQAALFEGPHGWTEFSPFLEYDTAEASVWLAGAYAFGWSASPPTLRQRIGVNATVPAVPAHDVAQVLAAFPGVRTVKVKVAEAGQNLDEDVQRVRAVREIMGADARLRLDANGGWSLDEALAAIDALAPFNLEYVEQPCASVVDLARVRSAIATSGVLIAADESIRKADDPRIVAEARAADLIVIKAQPLGGIARALTIVSEVDLPAVVSSALDTSIGLAMGAFLAAALPDARDAGLGTAALLAADVTRDPLGPHDGSIDVRRVTPDADLLRTHAADDVTTLWWRERIEACHHLLEEWSGNP